MALLLRSGEVRVVGFRQMEKDGSPFFRRDGSPVEFVQYLAEGEDRYRETTMDRAINGTRPGEGEVVELVLESHQVQEARTARDGRPYIKHDVRQRVVSFEPVVKSARAAA